VFNRILRNPSPRRGKITNTMTGALVHDQRPVYRSPDITAETISAPEKSAGAVRYLRKAEGDYRKSVCAVFAETRCTSSRKAIDGAALMRRAPTVREEAIGRLRKVSDARTREGLFPPRGV